MPTRLRQPRQDGSGPHGVLRGHAGSARSWVCAKRSYPSSCDPEGRQTGAERASAGLSEALNPVLTRPFVSRGDRTRTCDLLLPNNGLLVRGALMRPHKRCTGAPGNATTRRKSGATETVKETQRRHNATARSSLTALTDARRGSWECPDLAGSPVIINSSPRRMTSVNSISMAAIAGVASRIPHGVLREGDSSAESTWLQHPAVVDWPPDHLGRQFAGRCQVVRMSHRRGILGTDRVAVSVDERE